MTARSNREKLLSRALQLFSSLGYDGVGVQEIVEAAGVTKPTLYHYFGSKTGLLEALLTEHLEPMQEELVRASTYQRDLVKSLTDVARHYYRFALEHRQFYRLMLSLWFAPKSSDAHKSVTPHLDRQYRVVDRLFEAAEADHGNMRGRHHEYAVTFLGMLNSYISLALNGDAELDDRTLHRAVHQFMHGIFS